jgi:hypothetical protein
MPYLRAVGATIIVAIWLIAGCAPRSGVGVTADARQVVLTSLVDLIANPEKYAGRRVRTVGVATVGFESDRLYLSMEDARAHVLLNSVGLALHNAPINNDQKGLLKFKRVIVEGRYTRSSGAHSGDIVDISYVAAWDETQ